MDACTHLRRSMSSNQKLSCDPNGFVCTTGSVSQMAGFLERLMIGTLGTALSVRSIRYSKPRATVSNVAP